MTDEELISAVRDALYAKGSKLLPQFDASEWSSVWNGYLEGIGAARMGKMMNLLIPAEEGKIRVPDSVLDGFVEVSRDLAERMAVLGLP